MRVLSGREASIYACLCDTVVAPEPPLPAVAETDAVDAFDRYLADSPPLNRLGMRAMVLAAELAPRLLGEGGRLRRLDARRRGEVLQRAEASKAKPLVDAVEFLARLTYFGDDSVMRMLGYDARTRRP